MIRPSRGGVGETGGCGERDRGRRVGKTLPLLLSFANGRNSAFMQKRSGASIYTQATRFNEVPPGRSPEPRRRAIRASARFNTHLAAAVFGAAAAVFAGVAVVWITSPTPGFLFAIVRCSSSSSLLSLAVVAVAATPLTFRSARHLYC
ncbi:hypothetical protein B296_00032260 [Ensete ventricosum]|uniref:Uncharacterized protein n=1 Tax=Ensete ventricosum TaxID=4639 RepID=A0A426ZI01_ENSVE|nr:hypothetical protein B296_00032260 [Ensete ventricosum]